MTAPSLPRRRVRVWFGQHQIGDYIGEPAYANRYEAAMRRRFPGLEITNDPLRPGTPREQGPQPAVGGGRVLFSGW